MTEPGHKPLTLAAMYESAVRELAELDGVRARLLGRADVLRELCDAGLGETVVRGPAVDNADNPTSQGAMTQTSLSS